MFRQNFDFFDQKFDVTPEFQETSFFYQNFGVSPEFRFFDQNFRCFNRIWTF